MWREGGCGEFYVYHPDQRNEFGDQFKWSALFEPGTWHRIDQIVVMNTPGRSDGAMLGWLDGRLVLERRDVRYRDTDDLAIDMVYFSTFFGGGDESWASSADESVFFDDFQAHVISPTAVER